MRQLKVRIFGPGQYVNMTNVREVQGQRGDRKGSCAEMYGCPSEHIGI